MRNACTARLLKKMRGRLKNLTDKTTKQLSKRAARVGRASFTPRVGGVRSEFMAAILAAGSLKQSLKPGAMRDDPVVTINGMKGKEGYTRMSSGTLTSSIITPDRHLWSTLSATRQRKVLADLRSLSVQQEPRSLCLGIKVSMRLALPGKP